MGQRNLATVPKDQQALLERQDSWAPQRRNNAEGLVNLPEHVLESVKEFMKANRFKAPPAVVSDTNTAPEDVPIQSSEDNDVYAISRPSMPPRGNSASLSEAESESEPESEAEPEPEPEPEPESPERHPSSWSLSVVDQNEADVEPQPSMVKETPRAVARSPPKSHSVNLDYTSSAAEEELELQLPRADDRPYHQPQPIFVGLMETPSARTSAVKSSLTSNSQTKTPPCAQPMLSKTLDIAMEDAPAPSTKRRRMKRIEFGPLVEKVAAERSKPYTCMRLAPIKRPQQREPSLESPSPIASSTKSHRHLTPLPRVAKEQEAKVQAQPQPQVQAQATLQVQTQAQPHVQTLMQAQQERGSTPYQTPHTATKPPSVVAHKSPTPFDVFCQKYPTYLTDHYGSLWAFIRACVCLDFMRTSYSLHEYLWDEFIRSFSAGFLGYVKNSKKPLPAVEWFNSLGGPPTFTSFVVKQENLDLILTSYPELTQEAKILIQGRKRDSIDTEPSGKGSGNSTFLLTSERNLPTRGLPNASPMQANTDRLGATVAAPPNSSPFNEGIISKKHERPSDEHVDKRRKTHTGTGIVPSDETLHPTTRPSIGSEHTHEVTKPSSTTESLGADTLHPSTSTSSLLKERPSNLLHIANRNTATTSTRPSTPRSSLGAAPSRIFSLFKKLDPNSEEAKKIAERRKRFKEERMRAASLGSSQASGY